MKATINSNTQFYIDLLDESKTLNVNSQPISRGYWNLIISIRDTGLYSKGIKPHRHWKITDVKTYFGVKGNPADIYSQLQDLRTLITTK
jgi:hypothetical protein